MTRPPLPLLAALVLLAPCLSARQAITVPALPDIRACAENEPALGATVTFPTGLPPQVLVEIAEEDILYVMVDDAANQADAQAFLQGWGANLANVQFVQSPTDSIWTRDWSASAGFDAAGQHRLLDPIFLSYTYGDANARVIKWFPGGHLKDDVSPAGVAAHTGVGHVNFPAHLVGGNIDFDGLGNAFCSQMLLNENEMWGVPNIRYRELMRRYFGVEDLRNLPNYVKGVGLQHIDCVLKVMDEETLIITRVPTTHPNYATIEALAVVAQGYLTPYGRPYQIHRIDAPVFDGTGPDGKTTNYANTLILNGKILVPAFNQHLADHAAQEVFRQAMPGYEVIGFSWVNGPYPMFSYSDEDSLHCRTHQIFDPDMVLIKHPRVRSASASDPSIPVQALIRAYSGTGLVSQDLDLFWRVAGSATWNEVPLVPGGQLHEFGASIPAQPAGTAVEYYLSARDSAGQVQNKPPLPLQFGGYTFTVQ